MGNTRSHIILEKAHRYPDPIKIQDPNGFIYDEKKGYWIDGDGAAMINSPNSCCGETKKCDIETGEDQKGE